MSCPLLGNTCASNAQLISIIPDLKTFGGVSSGTITLTGETSPGDTIVIGGKTLTAVAGVAATDQWSIDGDEFAELDSILIALINDVGSFASMVTASIRTPGDLIIDVSSISTGIYSQIPWSTTGVNISLSPGDRLSGGECDLNFFSSVACSQISKGCWGVKTLPAHIYLTAHLIEMANGNAVGQGTSRTISAISESYTYVAPPPEDAYYANTKWGLLYRQLWRSLPKIPTVGTGLIPRSWPRGYGYRGRCGC